MGVIVFILAFLISIPVFTLAFLYMVFKSFLRTRIIQGFKNINKKFWILAKAFDKYGNVVCSEIMNDSLIKKSSTHRFGNISETISMVVGYNLIDGTLTMAGKILNASMNFFDSNHALKAIERDKISL